MRVEDIQLKSIDEQIAKLQAQKNALLGNPVVKDEKQEENQFAKAWGLGNE